MTLQSIQRIECQACAKREYIPGSRCHVCSGFGFVVQQLQCGECETRGWFRPVSMTSIEGRDYVSIDGVTFIAHNQKLHCCSVCEAKNQKESNQFGLGLENKKAR
jgi:hypothetical protein